MHRNKKKHTLSFLLRLIIVSIWLCMLGVLIQREVHKRAPVDFDADTLGQHIDTKHEWAGIYFNNNKIGYTHTDIKKVEEGYHFTEQVFLDMSLMNVPQQVHIYISSVTDRNFLLKLFSFKLKAGVIQFVAFGSIEGTVLKMVVDTGAGEQKKTFSLPQPPIMASSLKYAVLKHGLTYGEAFTRTIFDPATMGIRTLQVEIEQQESLNIRGKIYQGYKIRQIFDGITVHTWIDAQGNIIKEESPMGLVMIREDEHEARTAGWGKRQDMVEATAVKVKNPFLKDGLVSLRLSLKNVALDGFMLQGGRQLVNGDCITISLEQIKKTDTYELPYKHEDMQDFLKPEPFIESDDDGIRQYAATIIGATTDAQSAVRLLCHWVYATLEKRPTVSIPSARAVLAARQGDCNEHAVLFVALCRAAGIPARICAGLVYMRGGFYYHAWAEVYLTTWVSIDPTLNQFPADVTHIKFVHGSLEQQTKLLKLIGKLSIEVIEYL